MNTDDQVVDRLLHVADIHFWKVICNPLRLLSKRFLGNINVVLKRRHEFATKRAGEFAEHLASVGIEHALLTGDFTSTSLPEEFEMARAFVQELKTHGLAISLMPGNHDVYTFQVARSRLFEKHFSEWVPPQGYPAITRLPGGTPLIQVPTVCPNLVSSKGCIARDALKAIAMLLEQAPSPLIVAGHYPILAHTSSYSTSPGRRLRQADALRELLGQCGKRILYVCGHVHRFSYVADEKFDSLEHLSTGALFRRDAKRGRQGEFSVIEAKPSGFSVVHHVLEDEWKTSRCLPEG